MNRKKRQVGLERNWWTDNGIGFIDDAVLEVGRCTRAVNGDVDGERGTRVQHVLWRCPTSVANEGCVLTVQQPCVTL